MRRGSVEVCQLLEGEREATCSVKGVRIIDNDKLVLGKGQGRQVVTVAPEPVLATPFKLQRMPFVSHGSQTSRGIVTCVEDGSVSAPGESCGTLIFDKTNSALLLDSEDQRRLFPRLTPLVCASLQLPAAFHRPRPLLRKVLRDFPA